MSQAPPNQANTRLQAALDSLDLDLGAEFQRYQRQRPARLARLASPPSSAQAPSSLDHLDDNLAAQSHQYQTETVDALDDPGVAMLSPWEQTPPPPEDYLKSSEELLKSLDEEGEVLPKKSAPRWQLVLGLLGATLLGGGLVALAIAMPDLFTRTTAPAVSNEPSPVTTAADQATTPSDITNGSPATVNLASQEFIELRLENLSVIDPRNGTETTTATPTDDNPTETTADNTATTPELNPIGLPGLTSPLATPDGLKVGYFYIISRDTSAATLGKAKQAVEEAFIRQFPVGPGVQMAEVDTVAKAQTLVRQFQGQGITAEIYHHQLSPAL
ncbi:hypothetical protein [Picosynechococcus sp. NKBG15041c]|uniref:hypothetical protein n=1 Tax=Picosynechococcus sp. NKBG15041c TaxID=1407650 RepID=UPI000407CB88|nr:hypothetical protein [Picosynechococcus sp. NKBG15041c]